METLSSKMPQMQPALYTLSNLPIREFVNEFLMKYESKETRSAYHKDLALFLKYLHESVLTTGWSILDINLTHLNSFKELMIQEGLSDATVNRRLGSIKAFLHWAMDLKYIKMMDLSLIHLPKVSSEKDSEPFTDEEINRMLNAPDLWEHKGRVHSLIMTMIFNLGLNRSEIIELKVGNIIEREGSTHLQINSGKDKERMVLLSDTTIKALDTYFRGFPYPLQSSDYIIQTNHLEKNIKPMDGSTVYRVIERYSKALGINKKASPRTCRETAIKNMLKNNSKYKVAADLGHINIATTGSYLTH